MEVMATALLVALALGVVGAGAGGGGGFFRRRLAERASVKDYQQALDTLRDMSVRRAETEGGTPRRAPSRNGNGPAPVAQRRQRRTAAAFYSGEAAVSVRVDAAAAAEAESPVVEVAPTRVAAETVHHLAAARDLVGTRPTRTMPSKRKTVRPGRTTVLTAGAVSVIVAVTVAAIALGPSHHSGPAGPTVVHHPATTQVAHRAASGAPKPKTSTSHASAGALAPVTSTSSTATYRVGSSSFTLSLLAAGACWVEASDPSTGQVLWTGTMQAGQAQQVPSSGELLLRLGDARNVAVTAGGRQVVLPPGFDSVIDLTFQPA